MDTWCSQTLKGLILFLKLVILLKFIWKMGTEGSLALFGEQSGSSIFFSVYCGNRFETLDAGIPEADTYIKCLTLELQVDRSCPWKGQVGTFHSWSWSVSHSGNARLRPPVAPSPPGWMHRCKDIISSTTTSKKIATENNDTTTLPQEQHSTVETCPESCCPGGCHIIARGGSSVWKARYRGPARLVSAPGSPLPYPALIGLTCGVKYF